MGFEKFGLSMSRRKTTTDHGNRSKKVLANIHWGGPLTMCGALVTAILLALSHHMFYQYLNDRSVEQGLLSQASVNNIATALAFVTKLFFVIAAGVAYVEWQWLELGKNNHKIEQVDALTGALEDVTNFLQFRTWIQKPILFFLAIITWLLPIAAIFTPGTLSVQAFPSYEQTTVTVPQIQYHEIAPFLKLEFTAGFPGASSEMLRIALASSTSGQILGIPSQNANQSYLLEFYAPSLRCAVSENQGIFAAAQEEGVINRTDSARDISEYFGFMALVPGDLRGILGDNFTAFFSDESHSIPFQSLDVESNDTARIYVMPSTASKNVSESALLECQLWNASYATNFTFKFPYQDVSVTSLEYLNPVNGSLGYCPLTEGFNKCVKLDFLPFDHLIYQAIMHSFGQVLAGMVGFPNADNTADDASAVVSTFKHLTNIDWSYTETARRGLEQLFQNITMSIMSSNKLANMSAPYWDKTGTPVILTTYLNRFVYSPGNLLLAYGISFIVTFICTGLGFYAVWENQGSFQNSFSTFIRATWHRNPEIDVHIAEHDRGAAPLPKDVATAKIRLGGLPVLLNTKQTSDVGEVRQEPNHLSQTVVSSGLRLSGNGTIQSVSSPASRVSSVSIYSDVEAATSDIASDVESYVGSHGRDQVSE